MKRHLIVTTVLVCMLVVPTLAQAGGWALVTLDAQPNDVRPNQPFTVGFMVRQHGITPNGSLTPIVSATNGTGDTITVQAQPEGAEGHYVATLQLPEDTWEWQIDAMHPMAHMGTLEVRQAAPAVSGLGLPQPSPTWWLWLTGVALVIVGGVKHRQRAGAMA